jgi:hypothetical protein
MRSCGGGSVLTRLPVPALAVSQAESAFTVAGSSEASVPKWRGKVLMTRCHEAAASRPGG